MSYNSITEIDSCSPLELLKFQKRLKVIAEKENILFVGGKGTKKTELQQHYEKLEDFGKCLIVYKDCFDINDFLRAFEKCEKLQYPLPTGITNYGLVEYSRWLRKK